MKVLFALLLVFAAALSFAQQNDPATGAYLPAQAAADAIKVAAGTDGAFLAAGEINVNYDPKDLATLINFPAESISIIDLTGADLEKAFERSVSLYPLANNSFLQVSGFGIVFKAGAPAGSRIQSVTFNGQTIQPSQKYSIAMSSGLAAGAMGYFKIWDKSKISKSLDTTLEQALKGKPFVETSPRWVSH